MSSKKKFKHNKKRNVGLVYEFLVRKMSQSLLENNSKDYKKALKILKRYFASGTQLDSERSLFEAVITAKGVSSRIALGILSEVKRLASTSINFRYNDIKKNALIKEVHRAFGKSFFSEYRLDNYRLYGSIQQFIDGCNPKRTLTESVNRVYLEESLKNHMVVLEESVEADEPVASTLAYKIAVKKFNEAYDNSLSESQKRILRGYISSLADEGSNLKLASYFKKEKGKLLTFFRASHSLKEIAEDKLMLEKLKRAEDKLISMDMSTPTVEHVEYLMLYCKLAEEMSV